MADENIVIPGLLDQEHEQHNVRLSGIDAPEKSQPFGQQAKKSPSELAYGRRKPKVRSRDEQGAVPFDDELKFDDRGAYDPGS